MVQKMSEIFFQYRDFLKSRHPGFFSKHVFCPQGFELSLATGIFQKIFGYREISVLEKFHFDVFARLQMQNPYRFYYLWLALPKILQGFRHEIFEKSRTGNYFKTGFLPVSSVGIFAGASLTSITTARPREVATLWPTMFTLQPTRRLRVVLGAYSHRPLFPFPLCSHCYSSFQSEISSIISLQ